MSRSARHLLHISDVGGAAGVDFSKLSPDVRPVVTHRLVEADDQPSDLAAGTIVGVVAALARVAAVPPRRARLHAESNFGPRDVDVDRLADPQSDRVLSYGNRKTGFVDRSEDVVLESALSGQALSERPFEPSLHRRDAILASTAMTFEVVGRSGRSYEAEMPRILCRTFEPELVEVGREPEEHAQRGRDEQAVVESSSVTVGVEPSAPPGVDPRRCSSATSG